MTSIRHYISLFVFANMVLHFRFRYILPTGKHKQMASVYEYVFYVCTQLLQIKLTFFILSNRVQWINITLSNTQAMLLVHVIPSYSPILLLWYTLICFTFIHNECLIITFISATKLRKTLTCVRPRLTASSKNKV